MTENLKDLASQVRKLMGPTLEYKAGSHLVAEHSYLGPGKTLPCSDTQLGTKVPRYPKGPEYKAEPVSQFWHGT